MKTIKILIFSIIVCLNFRQSLTSNPIKMIINQPTVSLRTEPGEFDPDNPTLAQQVFSSDSIFKLPLIQRDPGQETQLLLGENVLHFPTEDTKDSQWIKVLAVEQSSTQHPCNGYIEKSQATPVEEFAQNDLVVKTQLANVYTSPDSNSKIILEVSIGTKLKAIETDSESSQSWLKIILPDGQGGFVSNDDVYFITSQILETEQELRSKLIRILKSFLGFPYYWGGRSHGKVDCSGLVSLSFRTCGLQIPRNSHPQFLEANKIEGANIAPGDLIFFAKPENPNRVSHVLIYTGRRQIIDASPIGVTISTDIAKLGKKISLIKHGETCGNWVIYFGSYLNDPTKIQELRDQDFSHFLS